MENSIDAGAGKITVSIEEGGERQNRKIHLDQNDTA